MLKTLSFWAAGTAATLLLCGKLLCPAPAVAAQDRGAGLPAAADLVRGGTHFLVRLDQEMAQMAQNAVRFQQLIGAFERTTGLLRMAIHEGRGG